MSANEQKTLPNNDSEIEDIFDAESEDALPKQPPAVVPVQPQSVPVEEPILSGVQQHDLTTDPVVPPQLKKKSRRIGRGSRIFLLTIAGLVACALLISGVIALVYSGIFSKKENPVQQELENIVPVETTNENTNEQPITQNILDSDKDGLSDDDESKLGTDVRVIDSDKDGLTDRQEVRIYSTNPLITDTDNDGYTDGEEVRGFYNPNGPGKLIDPKQAIDEFNKKNTNQ